MGNKLWGSIYNNSDRSKHDQGMDGSVQTSDATKTTVLTFPLAAGQVSDCEAMIIGRNADGSKVATFKLSGMFYRNSGGDVTRQGYDTDLDSHVSGSATYAATLEADTSAQAVIVTVTGEAGETVDWRCRLVSKTLSS